MKLHRIQGCPIFLRKEMDYLQSVVTAAKSDSVAIQLEISRNTSQLDKHGERITDADRDDLYRACVLDPHCLKGLSGQVLIGLDLQLGTRGVALEQTTWFNMYHDVPSNAQNITPQAFDMIAFGVAKDKTKRTGKMMYKSISRHAKAGWDVFASLGELLAWEIANGFQLLNNIKRGNNDWRDSTILFPGQHQNRVGRLRSCFQHITKQLPKWQKTKQLHLMRHTVTVMLAEEGTTSSDIDTQMDWNASKTQRAYMQDPKVSLNEQAILAGFTKGSAQWRQHHHLGRADVCVPAAWVDALIPGLSFLLANSKLYSSRAQETLKCINLLVRAYWQALPIKMLLYQGSCMKKQLPGVLDVMTSSEYAHFAGKVRQAELDSMHALGFNVPDLELWALKRSQCTDMPVSLTQTDFTAFAAANMATVEPPAKRQKVQNSNMQSQSRSSALLQKQQECEILEYKVLDARTKAAALELTIEQARLAQMEARHKSQQRRASCCGGRLQVAADSAAGTSLCSLQPTPTHDQYCMTDCTPANTIKGAVAGQATKQLIHIQLFKHKTVREVWKEWHYGTADQVSVKSRLRRDNTGRLSLYGKGYARNVSKELQQRRDLPEAIDCLISEQGLSEEVALQVVEKLAKQFELTKSAPNGNFNAFYLRKQWKHGDEAKASRLVTKQNLRATVRAFDKAYQEAVCSAQMTLLPTA